MPQLEASTPTPEPKLDNEVGSFLTLLFMIAAIAALGYSGLKFFDIIKLSPDSTAVPPAIILWLST